MRFSCAREARGGGRRTTRFVHRAADAQLLPVKGFAMGIRRSRKGLAGTELTSVAAVFRALSDPTRLRILSLVGETPCCVHELCAHTGMSQPAVSHQLRLLRVGGLVRGERVGREVFYSLDDEHVMELVHQARSHAGHLPDRGGRPPRAPRAARPAGEARPARKARRPSVRPR
jgi:DNA-binding transcriptional ArsR family regulator